MLKLIIILSYIDQHISALMYEDIIEATLEAKLGVILSVRVTVIYA